MNLFHTLHYIHVIYDLSYQYNVLYKFHEKTCFYRTILNSYFLCSVDDDNSENFLSLFAKLF